MNGSHIHADQLALYVWGDLPERESRRVESHLRACNVCQEEASAFSLLREYEFALPDPSHQDLAAVSAHVSATLRRRSAVSFRWHWSKPSIALAMVTCVLAISFVGINLTRQSARLREPAPVLQSKSVVPQAVPQPAVETAPVQPVTSRRRPRRKQKRGLRSLTVLAQAGQPTMFKLTTADPNVVVLWNPTERTELP